MVVCKLKFKIKEFKHNIVRSYYILIYFTHLGIHALIILFATMTFINSLPYAVKIELTNLAIFWFQNSKLDKVLD